MDKDIYLVGTSDGWDFDVIAAWSDADDAQAVIDEYNRTKEQYNDPADVMMVTLHEQGVLPSLADLIEHYQKPNIVEKVDPHDLVLPTVLEKITTITHPVAKEVETRIPETDLSVLHHGRFTAWQLKRIKDNKIMQQWFLPPDGLLSFETSLWEEPWTCTASIEWKIIHFDHLFYWILKNITFLSNLPALVAVRSWLNSLLCAEFHATIRTLAN